MILQAEKPKIHDGPAPKKYTTGPLQKRLVRMDRGQWIITTKKDAWALVTCIKKLGGRGVSYRASETQWCFKVVEPVSSR